ncbi:MAG: hypothetical protein ABS92_13715 [Thiobacillus sp. SCN 63-374]|nr:MAG: hypothetical protein ABS92_13715 [Thiobacillus sp. SCN 63-374]
MPPQPDTLSVASALRLKRVAVAFQFHAECGPQPARQTEYSAAAPYCRHFFSYEKDLLSHAFRQPAPVQSRCVPTASGTTSQPCELVFARHLEYLSEGTAYRLERTGPATLPARISASRSDFPQSGHSVLHLVVHIDLSDDPHRTLGEYEVLSLSKLWCPADDSRSSPARRSSGSTGRSIWRRWRNACFPTISGTRPPPAAPWRAAAYRSCSMTTTTT